MHLKLFDIFVHGHEENSLDNANLEVVLRVKSNKCAVVLFSLHLCVLFCFLFFCFGLAFCLFFSVFVFVFKNQDKHDFRYMVIYFYYFSTT